MMKNIEPKVCSLCSRLMTSGHVMTHDDGSQFIVLCRPCWNLLGFNLPDSLSRDERDRILLKRFTDERFMNLAASHVDSSQLN